MNMETGNEINTPNAPNAADGSGKPVSSYPKGARIIAAVAAVLLVLMYIVTLIAAFTTSPAAGGLFKACVGGSILLPIMFWLYIRFAKWLSK